MFPSLYLIYVISSSLFLLILFPSLTPPSFLPPPPPTAPPTPSHPGATVLRFYLINHSALFGFMEGPLEACELQPWVKEVHKCTQRRQPIATLQTFPAPTRTEARAPIKRVVRGAWKAGDQASISRSAWLAVTVSAPVLWLPSLWNGHNSGYPNIPERHRRKCLRERVCFKWAENSQQSISSRVIRKMVLIFGVKVKSLSCVWLFATTWTVAYQAPPSMGFSRQEYWNGLPFPSPGDLPNPGIKPGSPALQADALPSEPPEKPIFWEEPFSISNIHRHSVA